MAQDFFSLLVVVLMTVTLPLFKIAVLSTKPLTKEVKQMLRNALLFQ